MKLIDKFIKCCGCKKLFTVTLQPKEVKNVPCPYCGKINNTKTKKYDREY